MAMLTNAFKRANQISEEEKRKNISLSCVLNIIDGIFSFLALIATPFLYRFKMTGRLTLLGVAPIRAVS